MRKSNQRIRKKRSLIFWLLYYWLKLVCINPLTLSNNNRLHSSYYSLVYGVFLIVSYSYIFYCVFTTRLSLSFPGETPIAIIANLIMLGGQYLECFQTWATFGFCQNRIKLIVKSFMKVDKMSKKLNIGIGYEKCIKKLAIHLIISTVIFLIVWIVCSDDSSIIKRKIDILIWTSYAFPQITTCNRWTIFLWTLGIVKLEFKRINDDVLFATVVQSDSGTMTAANGRSSRLMRNSRFTILVDEIQLVGQLHRELRTAIYRTVEHIAVCILFDMLMLFLNITIHVHITYRFLKGRGQITSADFMYLAAIGFSIFVSIWMLTLLSNACGTTTDEANKTGNVLHTVLNDIDNFSETLEAAKFKELSLDLLNNQLRISVLGLFDLDHGLVFKVMMLATTYLTIMLQFYN